MKIDGKRLKQESRPSGSLLVANNLTREEKPAKHNRHRINCMKYRAAEFVRRWYG